jgi:hypothetical protein
MPKTARCKFHIESVTLLAYGGRIVKMRTQYDKSLSEDVSFAKATPSGEVSVQIDNPNVFDVFVPGKDVYVDVVTIDE